MIAVSPALLAPFAQGFSVSARKPQLSFAASGRYLPRNFVNPMQAGLFNAFCRSTENGDPARVVIMEEGLSEVDPIYWTKKGRG